MSSSRERGALIYSIQEQVRENEARRYSDTSSFIEELNIRSQEALNHLTKQINALVRSEDFGTDRGKRYRAMLLRKVRSQLRGFSDELVSNLTGNTLDYLIGAYQSAYTESGEVLGYNTSFSMPPKQAIIEAINYPWSGDMWSNRVWTNVDEINKEIEHLVVRGLMTGESNQDIAKLINRDLIKVGQKIKYVTERIIRTETARVRYIADVKCWKGLDVKKVQFLAFIDEDTSKFCRDHNKIVYDLGKEPMLPAHPHCRSCYIPYIEEKDWNAEMDNVMTQIESERVKIEEEVGDKPQKPKKPRPFIEKAKIKGDGEVWVRNEVNYITKDEEKYIKEYNKIKNAHEYEKYISKMDKLFDDGDISSDFYHGFLKDVKSIQKLKSKILVEGDYRVALTKGDVKELGQKMNTITFFKKLTNRDKEVIREYSGSSYREMNGYLRGLRRLVSKETKQSCEDLIKTLEKGKLTKDTLLFRGADIDVFSDDFVDRLMSNPQSVIGSTFTDKGFMSTSIDSNASFDKNISFQILAPKGTKGAYIKEFSQFSHESEFLLQANTELEIVDVKMGRDDLHYTMFCQVKNQG